MLTVRAVNLRWFALAGLLLAVGMQPPETFGQTASQPTAAPATGTAAPAPVAPNNPPGSESLATKIFDMKYIDPEQVQALFSARSFVMEVNRELKTVTVHGTPAFLKEVEDAVRRFDVAPAPPANIQVTIYLLTVAAQAPLGGPLPAELNSLSKDVTGSGAKALRLADSQTLRLREGQMADLGAVPGAPESASLSRIRVKGAFKIPGPKAELISLNGLQVWLNVPPATPGSAAPAKTDSDITTDVDVDQNQAVMVAKVGIDKPVVVVVRAAVVR